MSELHARFNAWLDAGAQADPPRDAAVHAAVCPACQRTIAALDALAALDLEHAGLPPSRAGQRTARVRDATSQPRLPRLAAGAVAVIVLAGAVGLGGSRLLASRTPATPGAASQPRVGAGEGQVLGATGAPVTPSALPVADSPSPTMSPTASASASAGASAAPIVAPSASTPAPVATPRRTAAPRSTPLPATPTAAPTRTATPAPTRTASPTPSPTAPPVTPSAMPTPTATPAATPTPAATATPAASASASGASSAPAD